MIGQRTVHIPQTLYTFRTAMQTSSLSFMVSPPTWPVGSGNTVRLQPEFFF
jgi:hypothetical protein